MKTLRAANLLFLSALFIAPGALCQHSGFGGGVFLTVGGESSHTLHAGNGAVTPLVGMYAEWLKPRVHPGLDLRYEGGMSGVHGTLVGPRASVGIGGNSIHPYLEALIGPNQANLDLPGVIIIEPGQQVPDTNRDGITVQGVAGLDFDVSQHCRWRIEFTQSRFSGIPDSHPYAVTTGIVVHFR